MFWLERMHSLIQCLLIYEQVCSGRGLFNLRQFHVEQLKNTLGSYLIFEDHLKV